jgi:hypothetical protein
VVGLAVLRKFENDDLAARRHLVGVDVSEREYVVADPHVREHAAGGNVIERISRPAEHAEYAQRDERHDDDAAERRQSYDPEPAGISRSRHCSFAVLLCR